MKRDEVVDLIKELIEVNLETLVEVPDTKLASGTYCS